MSLAPAPASAQSPAAGAGIGPGALATLLAVACLFGANHVAARLAFDAGLGVATAVAVRSGATAVVVALIVALAARGGAAAWPRPTRRQAVALLGVGALLTVQSACLYSAVARLPVALALLAFNSFPLWTALWAWVLQRQRPGRAVLVAMPVILLGLALALDVAGAASGLGAAAQWQRIGAGVAFAVAAAAVFGLALVLTQQELATLGGPLRTAITMAVVAVLGAALVAWQGGPQWPHTPAGWWGLLALTLLYGTAFTVMFTLLPRLGVVGHSPLLNVEPVASLVMAWALLGQAVAPVQVLGSLVVVGAVMALGLRR